MLFDLSRNPYTVTTAEEKWSKQKVTSPYKRLHSTATHNTSPTRIRNGGLVRQPDRESQRPISSESFFRPNKFDTPKTETRPMLFSHEYRVVSNPSPETVTSYRNFAKDAASRPTVKVSLIETVPSHVMHWTNCALNTLD